MGTLNKLLELTKERYYEIHLSIVTSILPVKLTSKERQILAYFMSFDGDIARDRFGTTARKIVKHSLNLSDGGLGNYLKSLKEKGFLIGENGDQINPILLCSSDEQVYQFKIVNIDAKK